jgi:acetylornithine/succinyldiaminopimelate/putrescine aminotransferase
LRDHNLIERSRTVGMSFRQDLDRTLRGRGVRAVRGEGLMVGIHLEGGAKRALAVTRALLAHGYLVLTGASAGDVLTLTPALTISEALLREFVTVLATVLDEPSTK